MNSDNIDTIDNVEYLNFIFNGRIWFGVPIFVFIINSLFINPFTNDDSLIFDILIAEEKVKFKYKGFSFESDNDNNIKNILIFVFTINIFYVMENLYNF